MSLQLSQISHSFGSNQALSDISLNIQSGEQVAIIGPSGCGKTTLLRIMGMQFAPTSGVLTQLGQEPALLTPKELKTLRTQTTIIPQHLGLVPNVSVFRNILNGGLGKLSLLTSIRQMLVPNQEEKLRAYHLLQRTGISDKMYDQTDSLSGGQQQRVAVARALYQEPSILLADEPVSSIDPTRARSMIKLLTQLSKEEGITLIISIHNLELAKEFFPRLVGLKQGAIAFDSPPDGLSEEQCAELYKIPLDDHG